MGLRLDIDRVGCSPTELRESADLLNGTRAILSSPLLAVNRSVWNPASSSEARTGFALERVRQALLSAHRLPHATSCAVEERVRVLRSARRRADPRDFDGEIRFHHASNRTPDDGHADQFAVMHRAQGPATPYGRFVVTMPRQHDAVGFLHGERNEGHGKSRRVPSRCQRRNEADSPSLRRRFFFAESGVGLVMPSFFIAEMHCSRRSLGRVSRPSESSGDEWKFSHDP